MTNKIDSNKKEKHLQFIKSNFTKMSEREIARRLRIGKTTVNVWCKNLGLVINKNTVNDDYFKIWKPKMAYILGYILTDGNISWNTEKSYKALTITAAVKDKDNLEKIRLELKSTKELLYSKHTKSYRLIVNSKPICIDLMNFGIIPRKSLIVKFPKIPDRFLNHFIRGVVDGDGNVRYVNRKRSPYFEITICSGSREFLDKMSKRILSMGIYAKVRQHKNNVYILQYSCQRGLKLAGWIYKNKNLYLDRKFQQYQLAIKSKG